MFDTDNEQKRVELHEESPNAGSENAHFFRRIVLLGVVVGVLIAALVLAAAYLSMRESRQVGVIDDGGISSSSENDGGLLGLQNPGSLTDIEPTTAEDLQDEFNSRPKTTPSDAASFERAITGYLTLGDFEGLDNYLKEQEQSYGGPSEEYAESEEDYSSLFPLWRADTQTAMNLIGKKVDNPELYFQNFSNPEILATTIAWAPLSTKVDAFLDYSALILPPPSTGDNLHIKEYDYGDKVNEVLTEISKMTGAQYLDVKSYDMEVQGHPIRVTVVMNAIGYYSPWTVQDLGGGINPSIWNKTSLKGSGADINYRHDIDGVYFLCPPDELPSKEDHPDWFDEFGIYIGPVGGVESIEDPQTSESAAVAEVDTEGGEDPTEEDASGAEGSAPES